MDFGLNISLFSLQVAIIFYYLCVVGLQFVAPVVLCVGFTLMQKTLGNRVYSNEFEQIETVVRWTDSTVVSHWFTGGYSWFGEHSFDSEECTSKEKIITLSNLLPSDENSFSSAREHWLVAISSFRQVNDT